MSLGHKALRGLLLGAGAGIFRLVLQLALQATLARLLVPEHFGLVSIAMISVSFAERILPLGIDMALTQKAESSVQSYQTGATVLFVVAAIASISYYNLAFSIADFFRKDDVSSILQTLCILFPIKALTKLHISFLQRQLRFKEIVLSQLVSYVIGYGVIALVFAYSGAGPWALIFALVGQALLLHVLVSLLSRLPLTFRFNIQECKDLLKLSGGYFLATWGNFFALQADNIIVGRLYTSDILGIYSRAYQIITLPATLFDSVVQQILFPSLSKLQDDIGRLQAAFLKGSSLVATLAFPASGLLFLLADDCIQILLGPSWQAATPLLQILSFGLAPRTCYKIADTVSSSSGIVYRRALQHWFNAIGVATGAFIGSYWGIQGIAIGVTCSMFGFYVLAHRLCLSVLSLSWKELGSIHLPAFQLAFLITAPCSLVTYLSHEQHLPSIVTILLVNATAGVIGYIAFKINFGFSTHSRDGIDALLKAVRR